MGKRETRVNKQADGRTGLSSRRQALLSIAAVTSSESSVGISAAPLNLSRGNERVAPDNSQHRVLDGVTGGESCRVRQRNKEGTTRESTDSWKKTIPPATLTPTPTERSQVHKHNN